jgi:hypothetical protein
MDFNYRVFSSNSKLIFLGIFSCLFLGKSLYFSKENFDFYSVIFFGVGFLGAYRGFYHFSFFELFPIFSSQFYTFLHKVRSISPVR